MRKDSVCVYVCARGKLTTCSAFPDVASGNPRLCEALVSQPGLAAAVAAFPQLASTLATSPRLAEAVAASSLVRGRLAWWSG